MGTHSQGSSANGGRDMVRVAAYARVSTDLQDTEMQVRSIAEYCLRRGWTDVVEYREQAVSGTRLNRPELNRLLDGLRRRRFDVLVVWRLDRLGRSLAHLVRLLEEFHALNVDLVSVTEALDTSTPAGRALFGMLGVFAQFERDVIAERVKEGMRNARRRGTRLGRPRLRPSESELKELLAMRTKGLSIRAISARVLWFPDGGPNPVPRHPSPAQVQRVVRDLDARAGQRPTPRKEV